VPGGLGYVVQKSRPQRGQTQNWSGRHGSPGAGSFSSTASPQRWQWIVNSWSAMGDDSSTPVPPLPPPFPQGQPPLPAGTIVGVLSGIILAAGASSRMGRTKALLDSGDGRTFLARLVGALLGGGADDVVAVLGRDAADVEEHAARLRLTARLVRNPDPDRGQLSSLLVGLDALAGVPAEAALIVPVDLPLVSAGTIGRVLQGWRAAGAAAARPVRSDGRHGHPVVFAARLFPELRAADLAVGARAVLRAHSAEVLDVPVDDEGAFEDIDTPADYERLIGPLR